jgi:nucleoside-diphosphate-sugar epimerase
LRLAERGERVRALVRRGGRRLPAELARRLEIVEIEDLAGDCPWERILAGVGRVVHLAGLAHAKTEKGEAADRFFRVNLDVTRSLGRAAQSAGVRRFVYLSSIKVNGEGVAGPRHFRPYRSSDPPRPRGSYAVSKWRAEQELVKIFPPTTGPVLTILRPPLVYAPEAGGNLALLQHWLEWGLPLPLPRKPNQRSLISRERLIAVIEEALAESPDTAGLRLPADPTPCSTAELAARLVGENRYRNFSLPNTILYGLLRGLGRQGLYRKLYGSMCIAGDEKTGISGRGDE